MKHSSSHGVVEFDWKHDLNQEEGVGYLPALFNGVVMELKVINASRNGYGHRLMSEFLDLDVVRTAKAVFLDCSPLFMTGNEISIMKGLHDFYAAHGFVGKTNNGYSRMWRIQDSTNILNDLQIDRSNDLHPVLSLIHI